MIKPDNPDPDDTLAPTRTMRQPQIHHTLKLLSTTTSHSNLNHFLCQGSGWLTRGDMQLVD